MHGRDEQLGGRRDVPEGRRETARESGRDTEARHPTTGSDERPAAERQAEADLLKTSGGDPLTQESD